MHNGETLRVDLEVIVEAGRPHVFAVMVDRVEEWFVSSPEGESLNMRLEPWPGGRFYRDLGDGAGHLWGWVQVIDPPRVLEIYGPAFVPLPSVTHFSLRLEEIDATRTRVILLHRGIGPLEEVQPIAGTKWDMVLRRKLKVIAEQSWAGR